MVVPLFLFGFQSLFSAQPLYDSWLLMCYNMFFTALPTFIFGVFEQDLSREDLLANPGLYKMFARNSMLSLRRFACWVGYAIFHSCLM